jgi:hypothetical protein
LHQLGHLWKSNAEKAGKVGKIFKSVNKMEITMWIPKGTELGRLIPRLEKEKELIAELSITNKSALLHLLERTINLLDKTSSEILENTELKVTPNGYHIVEYADVKAFVYRFD